MKYYKITILQVALVLAMVSANISCNTNKTEDSKEKAEDANDANFEKNSNEKDARFLVDVAEMNMEEINLGKLSQVKGTHSSVKELGKMMETSHIAAMASLTALAKSKMITLPTSTTDDVNEAYQKLDKKSGKEFDKDYADMMVEGHKHAIKLFEKAAAECVDIEIKTFASESLPELRTHLDQALKCQKECEEMKK